MINSTLEIKLKEPSRVRMIMTMTFIEKRIDSKEYTPDKWANIHGSCGGKMGRFKIKEHK